MWMLIVTDNFNSKTAYGPFKTITETTEWAKNHVAGFKFEIAQFINVTGI